MNKNEFDNWLNKLNLNKKDLSKFLNMPYGSVNNWNGLNKPFPAWLDSWFRHYEKSKNFDELMQIIEKYKSQNDK